MRLRFSIVVLMIGTACRAAAGEESALTLSKGTWDVQTYAAYAGTVDESLPSGNLSIGYYVFDRLALSVEGAAYGVVQDGPDAGAVELRLAARHHFWVHDRWTAFTDGSAGIFEASDDVPDGGTRFNFFLRAGVGLSYELKDGIYLIGGARYWHLSNAKLEGAERNPALNGAEGYVGLMWTWK